MTLFPVTLLNGLLALGSIAFTLPLVIHLFFRSRFRTVDWGAMHLLESVMQVNRRQIQLMNVLLLLLRCLIPILLAFCLARPVLTGFRSLPGDAPQSVVIAIDDSRSMGMVNADGVTRMQRARQALDAVLAKLSRRDEVMVIRSSRLQTAVSQMGPADAKRKLAQVQATGGPVDLGRFVRAASEATQAGSHAVRRVIVVSDFPSSMVDDASLNALEGLGHLRENKSDALSLSWLNVAASEPSGTRPNVSVESVQVESAAVVVGREATFTARIRNHGDQPVTELRWAWSVAGKK